VKPPRILVLVTVIGGALASARVAHAGSRLYNGAACQNANNAPGAGTFVAPLGIFAPNFQDSGFTNVTCLVERTNLSNTNGLAGLSVRLLFQIEPAQPATCFAITFDTAGNQIKSVRKTVSAATAGQVVKLDWGTSVNAGKANGAYALYCSLPNGAGIMSYTATEF
jgi:hypothetical protein